MWRYVSVMGCAYSGQRHVNQNQGKPIVICTKRTSVEVETKFNAVQSRQCIFQWHMEQFCARHNVVSRDLLDILWVETIVLTNTDGLS